MNRSDIEANFKKLNSSYSLYEGVLLEEIHEAEVRLGVIFPEPLVEFYKNLNWLSVMSPKFDIYSIKSITKTEDLVVFGCFNNEFHFCFDSSHLNSANQWNIINLNSKYIITLTIASFLSNKMLAWLLRGREVWVEEKYT